MAIVFSPMALLDSLSATAPAFTMLDDAAAQAFFQGL